MATPTEETPGGAARPRARANTVCIDDSSASTSSESDSGEEEFEAAAVEDLEEDCEYVPGTAAPAGAEEPASEAPKPVKAKQVRKALAAKKAKTDESSSVDVVAYLMSTNRPYNSSAIYENLHKPMSKPKLQALIDAAVRAGSLCEAGETNKVYFYNQELFPVVPLEQADVEEAQLEASEAQLLELQAQAKALESQVSVLCQEPTNEALQPMLAEVRAAKDGLESELKLLLGKAASFGPTPDLATMRAEIAFWNKHEKQMRSRVMELVLDACAGSGLSESDMMDKMGCE